MSEPWVVKFPVSLNEEMRPSNSSIARKLGPGACLKSNQRLLIKAAYPIDTNESYLGSS
jgi:hypothetical protein